MDPSVANVTGVESQSGSMTPWFDWLDAAIRREIVRLRARYELSLDEFRGLYVSDEQVEQLLGESVPPEEICPPPATGRIGNLGERFDLNRGELACLFAALAPELDLKYATLYAYLNNDASAKSATVDLLIRLCHVELKGLLPDSPLLKQGLLIANPGRSPLIWRSTALAISAPALHHFAQAPSELEAALAIDGPARILLGEGARSLVLEASPGSDPTRAIEDVADQMCMRVVSYHPNGPELMAQALKARLQGAILYFPDHSFQLVTSEEPDAESQRFLGVALGLLQPTAFAVSFDSPWRKFFEGRNYERIRLEAPTTPERAILWQIEIARAGFAADPILTAELARLYVLHPGQIKRAVGHAARRTPLGDDLDRNALTQAAREQGSTGLQGLGVKETTVRTWCDLVLAEATRVRLRDVESAIRTRETVFDSWGFKQTSMGRTSLRILFSGASGTGKTLSATIIANEVGLDMYRIDLSSIVSKYIGETERNLERVFRAAEGSNAIIFFDEADALFGKRTEIKDAHDRYANIEISYLLQRMEQYDGVMILATNLSKNIDEAFSRRIHFNVEFPMPSESDRLRLWELSLPVAAPRDPDLDIRFLARQFTLAGGDIRNVALDGAFLAAGENQEIGMRHLIRAMARQRLKQGKLPSPSEFKQYFKFVGPIDTFAPATASLNGKGSKSPVS